MNILLKVLLLRPIYTHRTFLRMIDIFGFPVLLVGLMTYIAFSGGGAPLSVSFFLLTFWTATILSFAIWLTRGYLIRRMLASSTQVTELFNEEGFTQKSGYHKDAIKYLPKETLPDEVKKYVLNANTYALKSKTGVAILPFLFDKNLDNLRPSRSRYVTIFEGELSKTVSHIVLDSKHTRAMRIKFIGKRVEESRIAKFLGTDFTIKHSLGNHLEAYTLFTPEVIEILLQLKKYDIVLQDKTVRILAPLLYASEASEMERLGHKLTNQLNENILRLKPAFHAGDYKAPHLYELPQHSPFLIGFTLASQFFAFSNIQYFLSIPTWSDVLLQPNPLPGYWYLLAVFLFMQFCCAMLLYERIKRSRIAEIKYINGQRGIKEPIMKPAKKYALKSTLKRLALTSLITLPISLSAVLFV